MDELDVLRSERVVPGEHAARFVGRHFSRYEEGGQDVHTERDRVHSWLCEEFKKKEVAESVPLGITTCLKTVLKDDMFVFDSFEDATRTYLSNGGKEVLALIEDDRAGIPDVFAWLEHSKNQVTRAMGVMGFSYEKQDVLVRVSRSMFQRVLKAPRVDALLLSMFEDNLFHPELDMAQLQNYAELMKVAGYLEELNEILVRVTGNAVKRYISEKYSRVWDRYVIPELNDWVCNEVYPRISALHSNEQFDLEALASMARNELARIRTSESFDMVIDYPHSTCALEEMRVCLQSPSQRNKLESTFISACERRLLHAGANTVDIISFYISTIRSFLIIDHRAVLLDKVCRPVRRYLKEREDTIQKIVFAMLDESEANPLIELAVELRNGGKAKTDVEDAVRDLNWVPDPTDALPDFRKGVVSDIIESLISLFDSKDIFMGEFVNVFADKLLRLTEYDTSEIMHKLELLKLKFGDTEFSSLDVMLKDFADSKGTDAVIHKEAGVDDAFHSSILSHMYWPALDKEDFVLPDVIKNEAEKYAESFKSLRKGRKIAMHPSLGTVTVELEFADRQQTFVVSPDKVAVLNLFKDGQGMGLTMICEKLQMSEPMARKAIVYWLKAGVLQEASAGVFVVVENQGEAKASDSNMADNNIFDDAGEDDLANSMSQYWPFILGMLTNLGATPVPKMQSFLQMLVPKEIGYTATQNQLENYLNSLVDDDKLELASGGSYKLKK